jgi:hypothetical protein
MTIKSLSRSLLNPFEDETSPQSDSLDIDIEEEPSLTAYTIWTS